MNIAPEIFKAYDIRGIIGKNLTAETAYQIGRALATEAASLNVECIAVARDGRLSGPELATHLIKGITDSVLMLLMRVCSLRLCSTSLQSAIVVAAAS